MDWVREKGYRQARMWYRKGWTGLGDRVVAALDDVAPTGRLVGW